MLGVWFRGITTRRQTQGCAMQVLIKTIRGNWNQGFSLDKHIVRSTPIGYNGYGHMQFDTLRTEVGESLFQLKYRGDLSQVRPLARAVVSNLGRALAGVDFVSPMPASKIRQTQPVYEVACEVARLLGVPYVDNFIHKIKNTGSMKDLGGRAERVDALQGCFSINEGALNDGRWHVLLIDDLYDTGASLEAVCEAVRQSAKIWAVSVVALTRRH